VHNQGSKSRGSSHAERRKEKERRGERRQFNQPVLIECCPAGAGTRVSGFVPAAGFIPSIPVRYSLQARSIRKQGQGRDPRKYMVRNQFVSERPYKLAVRIFEYFLPGTSIVFFLKVAKNSLGRRPCQSAVRVRYNYSPVAKISASRVATYCDTKGYNTSSIKICLGIIPARARELLERGCTSTVLLFSSCIRNWGLVGAQVLKGGSERGQKLGSRAYPD